MELQATVAENEGYTVCVGADVVEKSPVKRCGEAEKWYGKKMSYNKNI